MTNLEFVERLKDIQANYKTAYASGAFGWICNNTMIARMLKISGNSQYESHCRSLIPDGFMFDCVCLIKAVLWGWNGNHNSSYGGAVYASNGVPDISTEAIINVCSGVSSDFKNIQIGELVWMTGHVGIYCGLINGIPYCIECTARWTQNVLRSALGNVTSAGIDGHNRAWTKHGKLPYISYVNANPQPTPDPAVLYEIVTSIPVYTNSGDAKNKVNVKTHFGAGFYYVNLRANGMYCIGKVVGAYDGWINPSENIKPEPIPTPEPTPDPTPIPDPIPEPTPDPIPTPEPTPDPSDGTTVPPVVIKKNWLVKLIEWILAKWFPKKESK